MTDVNEIRALKASFRGASQTATALAALQQKVEAFDEHAEVSAEMIDELGRVTLAHALASNALRGLVETMRVRRGMSAVASEASGSSE